MRRSSSKPVAVGAVLRNTVALSLSRILEGVSGVVLTLLVARTLGPEDLGVYTGALAFYVLIAIGGQLGATTFLTRQLARDRSLTGEYLSHLGVVASVAAGVLAGITISVVPFLGLSPTLATGVTLILLAAIPGALNTLLEGVLVAYQRTSLHTGVVLVATLANVTVSVSLLLTGFGVVAVIATFVAVQFSTTLALLLMIRRYVEAVRFSFRLRTARRILREMRTFIASSALGALFARPEVVLLALLASDADIGQYSAALKIVDVWYFLPATFAINLFPVLSHSFHEGDGRAQSIQDRAVAVMLAVTVPVSVVTFVAAEPIVELLYGDGFGTSATALRFLAANVCLAALFDLFWRVLASRDRQDAVLRVQWLTTATRLGGGAALIIPFAAVGAAISTMANLTLHVALLGKGIRRDGVETRLVRLASRTVIAGAAVGLAVWLLIPQIGLVPALAAAAICYPLLALVLRVVKRADVVFFLRGGRAPSS
jgi:O-antigen/teichoic acid export membrane protein